MAKILILNGPNLNLLGSREPDVYGKRDLESINEELIQHGTQLGHEIFCYQANGEEPLIERLQQTRTEQINFLIINPAGYTHTSVALRDAVLATNLPFIEVHLSNIYKRESFRHFSYFSDVAQGVISGLGPLGYRLALDAASQFLSD